MCVLFSQEPDNNQELIPPLKFLDLSHAAILEHFPEGVFVVNTRWQVRILKNNEMSYIKADLNWDILKNKTNDRMKKN